jgi:hypothetical protein
MAFSIPRADAGEPAPDSYWKVEDLRPGMTGVGQTVMVGTKLEEFGVEILGVMRGVSPGRDMILCRLKGCNLEHAGIIQGMSGSPIYIDGKLLGAVAYAWEFAKDPIAGVTPFCQMVEFVRANERRVAAEAPEEGKGPIRAARIPEGIWDRDMALREIEPATGSAPGAVPASGGGLAGMQPIATPVAASGFSPRALALLDQKLGPLGLAPVAGGRALDEIIEREGDRPLVPGAPVSVAMVTGDFDLSGIGTVTHVEGDRVYAFGHPMMGLGACELPMMTGYIHTVYPRASVSMKMGSPLKVVGVLDTDVSTAVSGRLGRKPDMLPMEVLVRAGRYAEPHTYKVQVARDPSLLPTLVLTVLTSAIDTEGNLPDELTARLKTTIEPAGREPIEIVETLSGARYTGPMGPNALFSSVVTPVAILCRNPIEAVRIERIACEIVLEPHRRVADIESVRLASDRVEPGETLKAHVTLRPFKREREVVELELPIPAGFPEGNHEAVISDVGRSLQRRFRNAPALGEPRSVEDLIALLRLRAEPSRTAVYLHVAAPMRGLSIEGQALPDLPGSALAVLSGARATPSATIRDDLIASAESPWVVEGTQTISFKVARDTGLSEPKP